LISTIQKSVHLVLNIENATSNTMIIEMNVPNVIALVKSARINILFMILVQSAMDLVRFVKINIEMILKTKQNDTSCARNAKFVIAAEKS